MKPTALPPTASEPLQRMGRARAFVRELLSRGVTSLDDDAVTYHLALMLKPEGHPTIDAPLRKDPTDFFRSDERYEGFLSQGGDVMRAAGEKPGLVGRDSGMAGSRPDDATILEPAASPEGADDDGDDLGARGAPSGDWSIADDGEGGFAVVGPTRFDLAHAAFDLAAVALVGSNVMQCASCGAPTLSSLPLVGFAAPIPCCDNSDACVDDLHAWSVEPVLTPNAAASAAGGDDG